MHSQSALLVYCTFDTKAVGVSLHLHRVHFSSYILAVLAVGWEYMHSFSYQNFQICICEGVRHCRVHPQLHRLGHQLQLLVGFRHPLARRLHPPSSGRHLTSSRSLHSRQLLPLMGTPFTRRLHHQTTPSSTQCPSQYLQADRCWPLAQLELLSLVRGICACITLTKEVVFCLGLCFSSFVRMMTPKCMTEFQWNVSAGIVGFLPAWILICLYVKTDPEVVDTRYAAVWLCDIHLRFLGRLPKVDLIILEGGGKCPSVHPPVHKKFLRFQWNLVYR